MKGLKRKIENFRRKLGNWLIRKSCTKEEWLKYNMVKAGFYTDRRITTSFEVTRQDHKLMSENVGKKFNERYCVTRRLLMDREDELGLHVDYNCSYDPKKERWVYNAELRVLEGA